MVPLKLSHYVPPDLFHLRNARKKFCESKYYGSDEKLGYAVGYFKNSVRNEFQHVAHSGFILPLFT